MNILMTSLLDLEHNRNGVVSFAGDLQRLFEAAGNPVRFDHAGVSSPAA